MGFLPNIAVLNTFFTTAIGFMDLNSPDNLFKTCCGGV
jgi:hypothetical protein